GGAYASFGMITAFCAGQLLTGPVGMKSYQFRATRYYTNKPACGPKRGHGSVQPRFAFEIMCDMMAERLALDPIEFRKINAVPEHSVTVNGQKIGTLGLREVLDKVADASSWYERRGHLPKGRGLGVAASMYISGTNYPVYPNDMPQSSVTLRLDRSGRVILLSGAADIGQGSNSVLAQLATEELGVSLENIQVISGDSDLCPVDLGAYSSRITLMTGHAAQEALRRARAVLANAAAKNLSENGHWQRLLNRPVRAQNLRFSCDRVFHEENPEIDLGFSKVVELAESAHGSLVFTGNYRTMPRGGAYRGGSIGASPAYSCTAHVADVSVDQETGKITINKIYVAHDCGRAINPDLVEGQIEGSTYMGTAEVFLEHFITDVDPGARNGMLINPSLLDYRIPTSLDTPDIEAHIIEKPDPAGPYGAKEAGEGPLHSAIPAIANAIYDAVKIRLFTLPFSPRLVKDALRAKAREELHAPA
ncbi:MAG TPA: molybdopterin cofactor-binding domain-containing protein, partial [Myxococcota bacterium]|nr:molybdopterin cofactor-binding domain-containing protein [Myxococcota bacterium]